VEQGESEKQTITVDPNCEIYELQIVQLLSYRAYRRILKAGKTEAIFRIFYMYVPINKGLVFSPPDEINELFIQKH